MTLLEKFKKDHPNAPLNMYSEGRELPKICPNQLGYWPDSKCVIDHEGSNDCFACWNREYKGEDHPVETVEASKDETHGLDEVKTKLTITIELYELNNFTLASKIYEICENDNINNLNPLTISRMLDAEVCNERRMKYDIT